jgi:radical SAM protein with 4Fe4S-binding SPASM domain
MCAIRFRRENLGNGLMSFETFRAVVDQLPGLKRLHLQGLGEPFLNPSFFDMVRYAADRDIEVTASSNLSVFSRRMGRALAASGLRCLHVSIDGATRRTYESIRKGASFAKLLDNLELILEERRRWKSAMPALRMTVVLMRRNLDELPALVELASRLRMEQVFVQHLCHSFAEKSLPVHFVPMREFVRRQGLSNADPAQIGRRLHEARRAAEHAGIDIRLPLGLLSAADARGAARFCDWPWTGMYVSCEGHVMPCCMVSTPDRINFGSVREKSIADLWNGDEYNRFRDRLASNDPPEICMSCAVYTGTF